MADERRLNDVLGYTLLSGFREELTFQMVQFLEAWATTVKEKLRWALLRKSRIVLVSPKWGSNMVSSGTTRHPQDSKVLFGWKEIANFLDAGVRTAQRYERNHGLPVRRPAGKSAGAVMATVAELEAWVNARPLARVYKFSDQHRPVLAWEGLQAGIRRMHRLMDETRQLKNEIRATVRTLHSSIHVASPESNPPPRYSQHPENDALEDLGGKKQRKLLCFERKVRTTG